MRITWLSTRSYLLATLILSSSLYPQSIGEKIYDNKDIIGYAFLGVGVVTTGLFGISYCIKTYNERRIFQARTRLTDHNKINTYTHSQADGDIIKRKLFVKKNELLNKWKTNYQIGISISGAQFFSGRYNIAHALAFYLSTAGIGVLKRCIVSISTDLSGDVVANSCQFNGNVIIHRATSFASFTNCLLGNVQYHGEAESIIELLDTVVEGSIIFDKPGIVVVNNNSIIAGSIINGRIIRI